MTLHSPVRIIVLLALCVASCSRTAQQLPGEDTVLRLQAPVAAQETKTWIDAGAAGAVAPVYWSAGDRICVNGVTSSALDVKSGDKLASADFYLRNVEAPYTVIYPHSAFTGVQDDSPVLDIPAVQAWKDGSFAEGSALLYGFSESKDAPVSMQNLCGAITFTLQDASGIKIKSLSITSLTEGSPIAGRFSLSTEGTPSLKPAGSNRARIDMELPEGGITITPEGTSFFFSLPAGDYPQGFVIRMDDVNKHILRRWWLRPSKDAATGVTLGAGKLVVFAAQAYDPDAREICSAEDWEEFAAAYNAGGDGWKAEWLGKDGTVKIGEDFTAKELTRLNTLSDVLDGCGHTVTVTAGTTPLVKTLTGTIRNLTVAGSNTASDPSTAGATVFVTTLSGGTIENCCNKAAVILNNHLGAVIAGPFVRTITSGRVENCVNEGPVSISIGLKKSEEETSYVDRYLLAGGIVALAKSIDGEAVIKDCVNKADISVTVNRPTTGATAAPLQAAYGGIVGSVISGTADKYLDIQSCHNQGNIAVDFSPVPESGTKITVSAAGGIVGGALTYKSSLTFSWYSSGTSQVTSQEGVYLHMKGCTTTGNVHNGICHNVAHGDPNMNFAAGLIGIANGLKDAPIVVEDCTVQGNTVEAITNTYYQRCGFCMISAGLAGFAGHAQFIGCTVKDCTVGSLNQPSYAVAGGIGMAPVTFKMEGCKIFAHLKQIRCYISGSTDEDKAARTTGHYAMAFSLSTKKGPEGSATGFGGMRNTLVNPAGSSVTGCSFGGSVTLNTKLVLYSAKSGWTEVVNTPLTANNVQNYLTCDTFNADYYKRGIPSMVTMSDNTYWNGQ